MLVMLRSVLYVAVGTSSIRSNASKNVYLIIMQQMEFVLIVWITVRTAQQERIAKNARALIISMKITALVNAPNTSFLHPLIQRDYTALDVIQTAKHVMQTYVRHVRMATT